VGSIVLSGFVLGTQERTMVSRALGYLRSTDFQWTSYWAFHRIWLCVLGLALGLQLATVRLSFAEALESADSWTSLANDIFNGRPLADGIGLVDIEMPARAEDAAIVPVTMRVTLPPGDQRRLKALTLVVDNNPVPVAATFTFGDDAGVSVISTRVRVDSYTDVHVVAEMSDGKLYFVKTYVKASGGCSAPAAKNTDEAIASLGQMKFNLFRVPAGGPASTPREARIMLRHPNNSGLQRDQVTLLYIPANFVEKLQVRQGDALLFTMEAGISISEDPNLRFTYAPNGAATFKVEARDTQGRVFQREWLAGASEM
jgi:sulfur-oxidizing protein SoxY